MGKGVKSKVVKLPVKTGKRKKAVEMSHERQSRVDEEQILGNSGASKFVDKRSSMATKSKNTNSNSVAKRVRVVIDYSKLDKNQIIQARNKIPSVNTTKSGKDLSKNLSALGSKNNLNVNTEPEQSTESNQCNNPIIPADADGDGIVVTVHAPEGEFDDTDSELSMDEHTTNDRSKDRPQASS